MCVPACACMCVLEHNRRTMKNPDYTMRQDLLLHLALLHTLTQKNQPASSKLLSKIVLMSALFEEKPLFVPRVETHCHHWQNCKNNTDLAEATPNTLKFILIDTSPSK